MSIISDLISQASLEERMEGENIQSLIEQNSMKKIALEKATQIIQLLTQQLQDQKKNREGQLMELQYTLRKSYDPQIDILLEKIHSLQRQLSKVSKCSTESEQKQRKQSSMKDLFLQFKDISTNETKKRSSINTTYSKQSIELGEQRNINLKDSIYRYQILKNQEWKSQVANGINNLTKEQIQELNQIKTNIKISQLDISDTFHEHPSFSEKNKVPSLMDIIHSQQAIINQLRYYIQQIEESYKGMISHLEINLSKKYSGENVSSLIMDQAITETKMSLLRRKRESNIQRSELIVQNIELKNIIEKMIDISKKRQYPQSLF